MNPMSFIELPLHYGGVPRWLFTRMVRLASKILTIIADEYGESELINRIGNPLWFHSLSMVLGFDWDSSGTTTVTTAVLRLAVHEANVSIMIAGGKGRTALLTPNLIEREGDRIGLSSSNIEMLKNISKLVAKVDSCLLQDGYSLYHHAVFASKNGDWSIVQQGMNTNTRLARRYHWSSRLLQNFTIRPHSGIQGSKVHNLVLDLTSERSSKAHDTIVDLVNMNPKKIQRELLLVKRCLKHNYSLYKWIENHDTVPDINPRVLKLRLVPVSINWKALEKAYQLNPRSLEELLLVQGIGPSTIRALALISEIIYGDEVDWQDPLRYGYAFGGKDGIPYPVNTRLMDNVIGMLESAIEEAKLSNKERLILLKRLRGLIKRIKGIYYIKDLSK